MTSLKCWNSGVESNGAAFILSPRGCGYASRVPGAYGEEVSSSTLRFASQFLVRDPASDNLFHDTREPLRVRQLAGVETECLFVDVTEQVEGFDADVGSVEAPLQETPEVLHPVRVYVLIHVFDRVIDDRMLKVGFESLIGIQFVGEDGRACFDVLADVLLEFFLAPVFNHEGADIAAPLHHAHDHGFILTAGTSDLLRPLSGVHVAGFATDESLVDLDFPAELVEAGFLHCQPDAMIHEPRGLLGNLQPPMEFVGTDSVFAGDQEPCGTEPLFQSDRGVLENGSRLEGKRRTLMLGVALPYPLLCQIGDLLGTAPWAEHLAVRPTQFNHELSAMLEVRKPDDCASESGWAFHGSSMPEIAWNVKYVIALNS